MILLFTGAGKGKTTAALGQALRSVGEGKRVLMIQFIKGPWKSGEDMFLSEFKIQNAKFKIVKAGRGFVGILGDTLPIEEHRKAAEEGLALARKEIESGKWDIVILDEINNAVHLGLLPKEKVLELSDFVKRVPASDSSPPSSSGEAGTIHQAQPRLPGGQGFIEHLILTGRDAPKEFIERADLVTEMQDVKHPYEKGIKAKRGLEY